MAVYKEIGYIIYEIRERSIQIYNDACDYGYPVYNIKTDSVINKIKDIVIPMCDKPNTHRYNTGFTQTIEFKGGYPAAIEAGFEKATIQYVSLAKPHNGIIGCITASTQTSKEVKALIADN
jgi:hypothetical protein